MNTTQVEEWSRRMDARAKRMHDIGRKIQSEGLRLTLSVIVLVVFVFIVISLI